MLGVDEHWRIVSNWLCQCRGTSSNDVISAASIPIVFGKCMSNVMNDEANPSSGKPVDSHVPTAR
jgi:hypothetical protein